MSARTSARAKRRGCGRPPTAARARPGRRTDLPHRRPAPTRPDIIGADMLLITPYTARPHRAATRGIGERYGGFLVGTPYPPNPRARLLVNRGCDKCSPSCLAPDNRSGVFLFQGAIYPVLGITCRSAPEFATKQRFTVRMSIDVLNPLRRRVPVGRHPFTKSPCATKEQHGYQALPDFRGVNAAARSYKLRTAQLLHIHPPIGIIQHWTTSNH